MNAHLDKEQIRDWVMGSHEELTPDAVMTHLAECDACSQIAAKEAALEHAMWEIRQSVTVCFECGRTYSEKEPPNRCEHCGVAFKAGPYSIIALLVRTSYSRLYLAEDATGRRMALKEIVFTNVPSTKVLDAFDREARILRQLKHPQIPRFIDSFAEGEGVNTRLYLVQEFVEGTSLAEQMKDHRFNEDDARGVARQVLEILVYLQSLSPPVFHRDIKPANLLQRSDGTVVLVDFGAARDLGATEGGSTVGTFGYMPIEQLTGSVDETTDLYALGASLIHLLSRRPPWELFEQSSISRRVNVSSSFQKFIERLVSPKKKRFAGARAALDAFKQLETPRLTGNPWFRRGLVAAVVVAAASVGGYTVTEFSEPIATSFSDLFGASDSNQPTAIFFDTTHSSWNYPDFLAEMKRRQREARDDSDSNAISSAAMVAAITALEFGAGDEVALSLTQRAEQAGPPNADLAIAKIAMSLRRGDLDVADTTLTSVMYSNNPERAAEFIYLRGLWFLHQEEPNEALRRIAAAATSEPENVFYQLAMARLLHMLGESTDALEVLDQIENDAEFNVASRLLRARILLETGEGGWDEEILEVVGQLDNSASPSQRKWAELLQAFSLSRSHPKSDDTLERLQAAGSNPPAYDAEFLFVLARQLLELRDFGNARNTIRLALEIAPENESYEALLGEAILRFGESELPETLMNRLRGSTKASRVLGLMNVHKNNLGSAVNHYDKHLEAFPDDDRAHIERALIDIERHDLTEAEARLRKLGRETPSSEWLLAMGELRLRQYRPDDAVNHITRAISSTRDIARVQTLLGDALAQQWLWVDSSTTPGLGSKAIEAYREAGRAKRDYRRANLGLFEQYARAFETDETPMFLRDQVQKMSQIARFAEQPDTTRRWPLIVKGEQRRMGRDSGGAVGVVKTLRGRLLFLKVDLPRVEPLLTESTVPASLKARAHLAKGWYLFQWKADTAVARELIARATDLDDHLAEAHLALGYIAGYKQTDRAGQCRHFKRFLEIVQEGPERPVKASPASEIGFVEKTVKARCP